MKTSELQVTKRERSEMDRWRSPKKTSVGSGACTKHKNVFVRSCNMEALQY